MFALVGTILFINILILGVFIAHDQISFNLLAKEQSKRLMDSFYDRTELYIDNFLGDASIFNELISEQVMYNETYISGDLLQIEEYIKYVANKMTDQYPQIGVISYSDELGRFVGLRINPDNTKNLMLKDARTKDKLTIYSSDNISSDVITVYDEYLPQSRPWYVPVRENPITQWSEVYVNQDELMNLTISVSTPVLAKGQFIGVVGTDVTLDNINSHLKNNSSLDNGIIYIVDKNDNIVAHSTDDNFINVSDASTPIYNLMSALDVDNPIISSSMKMIKDENILDNNFSFSIDKNKYFAFVDKLDKTENLDFRAVVIIPEDDLMSNIRLQQNRSLAIALMVVMFSLILKIWFITYIIRPLSKVTDAAKALSNGDFSITLKDESLMFYETSELISAFNNMSIDLKDSFYTIKGNEMMLESMVLEKTNELEKTYEKLLEKEKLASLGGLVAGISHEINTPLGVSLSACSYLQGQNDALYKALLKGKLSKDKFSEYLESTSESISIINKNLTRAAELITSFKQISVDQSTSMHMKFFLKEYFESIFLTLKHEYKNKPFEYFINCDDSLEIYSNPGYISQIYTNLIMNSIKHGFIENRILLITIDVESNDDEIVIFYKDNGIGIAEENIKHIFEPFYTTKVNEGGSGLGLSIVYNLVTANLDGTITFESQLNNGVLFTIRIPKTN